MALIAPSQIPEVFVKAVHQGTALRIKAIQDLNKAVQDLAAALTVEHSRTTAIYGANSHQAILTNERVIEHSALSDAVAGELQQSQVRIPQPTAGEFVVYGRVLDSTGHVLNDMEVSATDPRGVILVNAISDANGRFELHVAAAPPAAPVADAGAHAGPPSQPTTFQLVVSDQNRATVIRSPEVLTATAGMLANREIKMPAQAGK
jgi:hypothetical protein